MNDLIERMAKAAFDCMQGNMMASPAFPLGLQRMVWEDESEVLREEWRQSIRAALAEARDCAGEIAMRSNLEDAVWLGGFLDQYGFSSVWEAAIDKVLAE